MLCRKRTSTIYVLPHNLAGSPALSPPLRPVPERVDGGAASIAGVLKRSGLLLAISCSIVAAIWLWNRTAINGGDRAALDNLLQFGFASGVVAVSLMLIARYRPSRWLPVLAVFYSIFGGFFLGALSVRAELRFPGVAVNGVLISMAIYASMTVGYAAGWLRLSHRFRTGLYSATAGIALVYLFAFVLRLMGISVPMIHGAGWGAILWACFVVVVASTHLIADFQRLERLMRRQDPKLMEWHYAIGLTVTLAWIYLSVLRALQVIKRG